MTHKFPAFCFATCLVLSGSAWAGFMIVNPTTPTAQSDAQTVVPPGITASTAPMPTAMPAATAPAAAVSTAATMPIAAIPVAPLSSAGNPNYAYAAPAPLIPAPPASMMPSPVIATVTAYPPGIINGFGRDIPLSIVIKQVVPADVHVALDPGIDGSMPVTWHGGKPWQTVLADAVRPNGLFVSENGNSVVISAMQRPAPTYVNTTPMMPVASTGMLTSNMYPIAPATMQPATLPPIEIPTWTAKSNQTLRQTLEDWCRKAGVTLRWDSEYDYPIETDVSLTGDFETSVRALLRGLKNANPSPVARYYKGGTGIPGVLLVPSPGNDSVAHIENSVPSVPQSNTMISAGSAPQS